MGRDGRGEQGLGESSVRRKVATADAGTRREIVAAGPRLGWHEAIASTVLGLGYELVDVERAQRGLLRVTIDRVPGHGYRATDGTPDPGEFVTVDDCERVTRQLQYALEVEAMAYARLEVSSPGLDRPLRREADYLRFAGQAVSITLRQPFEGRKSWQGLLSRAEGGGWSIGFKNGKTEQELAFTLDEVREARLVPVLDFKGRKSKEGGRLPAADVAPAVEGGKDR
jgi:ribosome maturation factor RimP